MGELTHAGNPGQREAGTDRGQRRAISASRTPAARHSRARSLSPGRRDTCHRLTSLLAIRGCGPAPARATCPPPVRPAPRPGAARQALPRRPSLRRRPRWARYGRLKPHTWGFGAPGVVRVLPTTQRVIALTFDACGGRGGSGYDQSLIDFLRQRRYQRPFSSTPALD